MQLHSAVKWSLLMPVLALSWGCTHTPEAEGQDRSLISVESILSVEEFREAGLEQLSESELEALDEALNRALGRGQYREGVDQSAMAAWEASEDDPFATFGLEDEHPLARAEDEMRAELSDSVTDWRGGTRFRLVNGQVWELAGSPSASLPDAEAGEVVTIRRGLMGSFRMNVEGSNRRANVRRRE